MCEILKLPTFGLFYETVNCLGFLILVIVFCLGFVLCDLKFFITETRHLKSQIVTYNMLLEETR